MLQNPGPFQVSQTGRSTVTAWTAAGGLVDASRVDHSTLVLTGGGLTGSRTLTLDRTVWAAPETTAQRRAETVTAGEQSLRESSLWRIWLPLVLVVAAALLLFSGWTDARALRRSLAEPPSDPSLPVLPDSSRRSLTHASH